MRFNLRENNGVTVLSVAGSLDGTDYPMLDRELDELKAHSPRVVLDLGGVAELGDQVASDLAAKRAEFISLGGDIKLVRAARVLDTLRLCGPHAFEIYPSRFSALKSFKAGNG